MNFVFLTLLTTISSTVAKFSCYQCNSHLNKSCDDDPMPNYLQKCHQTIQKSQCLTMDTTGLSIESECQEIKKNHETCIKNIILNSDNHTQYHQCENMTEEIYIESTLCRKIISRVIGSFAMTQGVTKTEKQQIKPRVNRGCGYIKENVESDSYCVSRRNDGIHQLSCSCYQEGCNDAQNLDHFHLTLSLLLLFCLTSFLIY